MSEYTSILVRQEREIVQGIIRREIPLSGNDDEVIRRLVERMWLELEGWHRLLWLWPGCDSDEPCNGKRKLGGVE